MIDLVKVQKGARWWFWALLIIIVAICFHPLWSGALAALFTPAAVKRLKQAVAEKERQAQEFQQAAEQEAQNVETALSDASEEKRSAEKTVEEEITVYQDNDSPYMED